MSLKPSFGPGNGPRIQDSTPRTPERKTYGTGNVKRVKGQSWGGRGNLPVFTSGSWDTISQLSERIKGKPRELKHNNGGKKGKGRYGWGCYLGDKARKLSKYQGGVQKTDHTLWRKGGLGGGRPASQRELMSSMEGGTNKFGGPWPAKTPVRLKTKKRKEREREGIQRTSFGETEAFRG